MVAMTEQGRQRVLEFLKDEHHHPGQPHFEVVDDSQPVPSELALVHAHADAHGEPVAGVGVNAVDLVRFLRG